MKRNPIAWPGEGTRIRAEIFCNTFHALNSLINSKMDAVKKVNMEPHEKIMEAP